MASKRGNIDDIDEQTFKQEKKDCSIYEDINDEINLSGLLERTEDEHKRACINQRIEEMKKFNYYIQGKNIEQLNEILKHETDDFKKIILRRIIKQLRYEQSDVFLKIKPPQVISTDKYIDEPPGLEQKQLEYMRKEDKDIHIIVGQLCEIFKQYFKDIDYISYFNELPKYLFYNHNKEVYCYSSYHYPIDLQKKHYIWFSQNLSQAILHPFDRTRMHLPAVKPVLYRFQLSDNVNKIILFNTHTITFEHIHFLFPDNILEDIKMRILQYFQDNERDIFNKENNIRLLYILEALNLFLPRELQISGYRNLKDQDEFGMINKYLFKYNPQISFYKNIKFTRQYPLVEYDEVSHREITRYTSDNESIDFIENGKILSAYYFKEYMTFNLYNTVGAKNGMRCTSEKNIDAILNNITINTIIYSDFDNPHLELAFNCVEENTYMQKYLKYKQKYIALKKYLE